MRRTGEPQGRGWRSRQPVLAAIRRGDLHAFSLLTIGQLGSIRRGAGGRRPGGRGNRCKWRKALEIQPPVADESSVQRMPNILVERSRRAPALRLGEPRGVHARVGYLISGDGQDISGTVMNMDGGFSFGRGTLPRYWRPIEEGKTDA
jgi:hypothetical protein